MNNTVKVNSFVKRQLKKSGKTYSKLSFKKIAEYAEIQIKNNNFRNGYRDGVIIVDVEKELNSEFICPFTKLSDDTKLIAKIVRRRPEEESYIQVRALNGTPLKTGKVELILYHHDVLEESNEQESDGGWELIAFNAIPIGIDKMPMGPITMMRNQLQLKGGTKGYYDSSEWAKSTQFWQKYAVLQP